MDDLERFLVKAEFPVWASDRADAVTKLLDHTSRSRGIRRPLILEAYAPAAPVDAERTERNREGRHRKKQHHMEDGVRFLLDGLAVSSIAELKQLVDDARSVQGSRVSYPEVVLGRCPHGVDIDLDFCPEGCRV